MLGLFKAAVWLAPVVELALAAAVPTRDVISPSSLITLELDRNSNSSALGQTTLDLRVFESTTRCGYGNVTLNGEPLDQDNLGLGSGSIITDSGSVLLANWRFTCVHLEPDSQVQLLTVHIVSVDGQDVDDVAFSVQFQQTAPISISHVDGATASSLPSASDSSYDRYPSLENELAELDMLKEQLLALEHSIAFKVAHISNAFNLDGSEELLQLTNCGGLKCFFSTIYNRMKSAASKLYRGDQRESGAPAGHPYWSSGHGGQHPLIEADGEKRLDSIPSLQEQESVSTQGKTEGPASIASQGTGHSTQLNQLSVNEPHQIQHILILIVVGLAIVINLTIMVLMFQCVRLLRQRRRARWEKRRRQLRESRDACNALVATKYMDLIQWLRDGLGRESAEDQEKEKEKETIMRRMHESDSDEESSDTLSISMEEEIAQFRAAAGFVGNLVAAEEGRGRDRLSDSLGFTRPRRASTPSSISTCPTYRSVDESLPAYDDNCSPEYVADGLRYTPASLTAASSSPRSSISEGSTACSSLDEDMEKKD
ncbi:hypothetical protein ANO14919_076850 [Xylariales sp. No.14919]|nr:hypothetical protein ANO14919_076850 [Xylariales sp. No.14919]